MKKIILLMIIFLCTSTCTAYATDVTDTKIIRDVELRSVPGAPDMGVGRQYSAGAWTTFRFMNSTNEGVWLHTSYMTSAGVNAVFFISILRAPLITNSDYININNTTYYINFQLSVPFRFFSQSEDTSLYYSFDNKKFAKAQVNVAAASEYGIGVFFRIKDFNKFYSNLRRHTSVYFRIENRQGSSTYNYSLDKFSYIYDFALSMLKKPY